MYLETNKFGISFIGYTTNSIIEGDVFDINSILLDGIPGLLVFHNMQLSGPVYINHEQKTIDNSFTTNGSATFIILGQYMILCIDRNVAIDLFKIISAIIANPTASANIDDAIEAINKIFVF